MVQTISELKTALIIVTLLLILSLAFNFLQTKENETELRSERLAKLHHKKLADSLERRSKAQADSLEVAMTLIAQANETTARERRESRRKDKILVKSQAKLAEVQAQIDSLVKTDTAVMILHVAYQNCDSLQQTLKSELEAQGMELVANQKALELSTDLNETLKAETLELRKVVDHTEKESVLREKNAKRKAFRRGLGLGILCGIVALVL